MKEEENEGRTKEGEEEEEEDDGVEFSRFAFSCLAHHVPSPSRGTTVPCTHTRCHPLPVSPRNSARHGSLFRECNVM